MNKTAIKNFAIWARNKLIADISYRAGLMGITADGIHAALSQSTGQTEFYDIGTAEPYAITGEAIRQRRHLVELIQRKEKDTDYKTAYKYIIEEVAYTWFNRLVAVRFMEVNDYLPSHIRVLSSDTGKLEPDLVTTPFDAELEFTNAEQQAIIDLKNTNKLDEVFRLLFIKQCNELNKILPALFEKTNDYTELLLNLSVIDQDGVVYHLVHDIPEEDFDVELGGQVEIIGWFYQYYISERHEEIINIYRGNIRKEDIPAATQLFTTDWVVRYMVDNSLGRYWIERNPNSNLKSKLDFLVLPEEKKVVFQNKRVDPTEITFFDPAMGSGHILVYAFDVFMEIYRECGYSDRDAAVSILKNNLYGLDIDKRAFQLSYFAVYMKARSYNRRIFTYNNPLHVSFFEESNNLPSSKYEGITNNEKLNEIGDYLIHVFKDAKELGSISSIKDYDYRAYKDYLETIYSHSNDDLFAHSWIMQTYPVMKKLVEQAIIMSRKYTVICTNPPYMNRMEGQLKKYVAENYKEYGGDLYSVFVYHCFELCDKDGYLGFMTPFVWMFNKTYEKLRKHIIDNKEICSLIQMEYSAFEEATVPICSFVLKNGKKGEYGSYFKLSEFKGGMEVQRERVLNAISDRRCGYYYETDQNSFLNIPGAPIAYWLSEAMSAVFGNHYLYEYARYNKGMDTGDNNRFLRLWFEIDYSKFEYPQQGEYERVKKWQPYNKGGAYRKWYGNNEYVINWADNGNEVISFKGSNMRNKDMYYHPGITWSSTSSGKYSCRYCDGGFLFDSKGCMAFPLNGDRNRLLYLLAAMNTTCNNEFLQALTPTIDYNPGPVSKAPVIVTDNEEIVDLSENCIQLSKEDWDSYELSWDFMKHPLIQKNVTTISEAYKKWEKIATDRFVALKEAEERLNRIFIDLYELQQELSETVTDGEVSVKKPNLKKNIEDLLSYAVGCMFGRYSLDYDGLVYAGGLWKEGMYKSFKPDEDNVIPITDEEYLEDDIVNRLCIWLKAVYGSETLEQNLDYIAQALQKKGGSSRESIRKYFLEDFFKNHCDKYSVSGSGKRPIYWLFSSGKQNGFKALIYIHRYNADTIGNLRVDYLHRLQRIYESEISRMQDMEEHSTSAREVAQASKRREKLQKQLKECRQYDEKLAHLALSRIVLHTDDGVKVNYRRIQTANDGKFYEVLEDSKVIMSKK